jgi:hypothetical protein
VRPGVRVRRTKECDPQLTSRQAVSLSTRCCAAMASSRQAADCSCEQVSSLFRGSYVPCAQNCSRVRSTVNNELARSS